ncbi:glycoside hydrolase family 5 protein [Cantharellus anzutake]|uniref:glycoside hydrolase family 5 protein n=1 Tax=Cantharellus anzutake TaxID=1750568 RepID=UPI001905EA11|nr:glycoside hydrolase family 5 protein [Cantharellus anzutake]KAF8335349.1 glycoside hydrolase family 5 protein [Cantharellus anzutake]
MHLAAYLFQALGLLSGYFQNWLLSPKYALNSDLRSNCSDARAHYRDRPLFSGTLSTTTEKLVAPRFPYGSKKVRGVNIGGWLVLEPWITPSLFDNTGNNNIVDEWTFCSLQDRPAAATTLLNHWNTFYTESDFAAIAAAGLNHVRVPIGYWAFDTSGGEPFINGQYPYLLRAVGWARNHGLFVIIDLHGVPGSQQNGFDNSGRRGLVNWPNQQSNIDRTNAMIKALAAEFSQASYANVVSAIQPINEPAGFVGGNILPVTRQYYYDSYGNIRVNGADVVEVLHDAFQDLSFWNGVMPYPTFNNVLMDTHHYQIFSTADLAKTWPQHIITACQRGNAIASWAQATGNLWTIVGEWTTTPYDCAKYLNGRGLGSRYDGTYSGSSPLGVCWPFTGSSSIFNSGYKVFMRQFFEAQTSSFEKAAGWIYWAWKTEATDEWSYQQGLAGGWIPYDPTQRLYPNICP